MQTYLLLLLVMAALFYFLILRPQQRVKREKQALLDALRVGVEVVTIGGIYGRVAELRDEDLDLEIADGVVLRVDRRAVASIVPDADADDLEEDEDVLADEDLVDQEGDDLDDEGALGDEGDADHTADADDTHDEPVDARTDAEPGDQGRTT